MTGNTPDATFSYTPGPHTAIVVAPVGVLIALPMSNAIVPQLYTALAQDPTAEAALDVLASHGISRMPSFGILAPSPDEIRLIVHGVVVGQLPDAQIMGKGVFTDTTVPPDSSILLNTPDGQGEASWPIRDGIVAAGRLGATWPRPSQTTAAKSRRTPTRQPAAAPPPPAPTPEPPAPTPAPAGTPSLGATEFSVPTMPLAAPEDPDKPFIDSFEWNNAPDELPLEPAQTPLPAAAPPETPEDMVGRTIRRAFDSNAGEQVAAVRCPYGHLNPPFAERCRVCQQPISQQDPITVTRPSLGHLRLSNGLVLTLDRGVVLGRNPHAVAGAPGPQPNLVRLNDPNKDISSQHLEVRLEGWFVTVRDLKSTNGTQVLLPGQPPITLRADEPMTIGPGAKVVLADVFDFVFEADQ